MSDRSAGAARDHEHVGRISTPTILFLIAAAALSLYELQLVLLPFVLAGVLAYVCAPAIDWASRASGARRLSMSIVCFLLIVGAMSVIGLLGLPPLARELKHVATDFSGTVNSLTAGAIGPGKVSLFGQDIDARGLATKITNAIQDNLANPRIVALVTGSALIATLGFFLTLVLLFFFLVSGPRIVSGLLWLIPPEQRPLVEDHILSKLDPVLRRYFIGVFAVVLFAAVFAYVGLGILLRVPHAIFLALITGLLEAIPMVGPIAAAAIAGVVALQHNSGLAAIIEYGIYLAALRLSIDQLFGPLVLGAAGRVHPTLIIFCFLAGGALFGIIGVILAVPAALVIRTTLAVLYDEPDVVSRQSK